MQTVIRHHTWKSLLYGLYTIILNWNRRIVEGLSYLLERIFKQCLSGDGDLHVAREGIGLRKDTAKDEHIWG